MSTKPGKDDVVPQGNATPAADDAATTDKEASENTEDQKTTPPQNTNNEMQDLIHTMKTWGGKYLAAHAIFTWDTERTHIAKIVDKKGVTLFPENNIYVSYATSEEAVAQLRALIQARDDRLKSADREARKRAKEKPTHWRRKKR